MTTTTRTVYYLQTDYQGSLVAVYNSNGTLNKQFSYDPWGRRRNAANWSDYTVTTELLFTRGYTGHEHLDDFGLINMNGRVYDPRLARFLSPDNYVQAPTNTQSYNRYSYCLNNPMKYTDPSGEKWWHWVLGAALIDPVTAITTVTVTGGSATVTAGSTGVVIASLGSATYATASLTATIASTTLAAADFTRIYFGTLFNGNTAWGGKQMGNWIDLEFQRVNTVLGTFRYDQKANGFEWPLQVINNLSGGEHLQDEIGNAFGHAQNMGGYIDETGFYKGRLVIRLKGDYIANSHFSGVSYGHYVFGDDIALNPDDTGHNLNLFAHEYGHTYQSRIMGPLYLFRAGIPSAVYQGSTEYDANRRGFGNTGVNQPTTGFYSINSYNPYLWWEFGLGPVLWPFMWRWNN
jgi:RHS repeat-associated protein